MHGYGKEVLVKDVMIVIPALTEVGAELEKKLLALVSSAMTSCTILVHGDSPSLRRNFFFHDNEYEDVASRYRHAVEEWCTLITAQLQQTMPVECEIKVAWQGRTKEVIEGWLENASDALLVLVAGSGAGPRVYRSIIRQTPCPVLMLFPRPWRSPVTVVAAIDPVHKSDEPATRDIRILQQAKSMSRNLSGSLAAVHSCFVPLYLLSYRKSIVHNQHANVREFLSDNGFGKTDCRFVEGDPVTSVRDFVARQGADILVLGSMSRGLADGFMIGSTADPLLAEAPCDLLLIHA